MTHDCPPSDVIKENKNIKIEEDGEEGSTESNKKKQLWDEMCHVCQNEKSKYKCPRCYKMTCSLNCSKKHKIDDKCSGKRDKTSFKPLSQFKDEDLISDLQFLRDIKHSSEIAKKKRIYEERKRRNNRKKRKYDENKSNEETNNHHHKEEGEINDDDDDANKDAS